MSRGRYITWTLGNAEIEADAPSESKLADSHAVCHVDPTVMIKLKELDLALKRQELDSQLLRLKALEIQADRDIQLCKLDLEA